MIRFLTLLIVVLPATAMADVIPDVIPLGTGSTSAPSILQPTSDGTTTPTYKTSFLGTNDLTIQLLTPQVGVATTNDSISLPQPPSQGNNPDYLTNFMGNSTTGTGSGDKGNFAALLLIDGTATANGTSLQLNFGLNGGPQLGPTNSLIFGDVDGNEKVTITAFNSANQPLSLAGWALTQQYFTGDTNVLNPSPAASQWATFTTSGPNNTIGSLTAPSSGDLDLPLNVLTPDQDVAKLIITDDMRTAGAGVFFTASTVPEPSSFVLIGLGAGVVLAGRALRKVRARHVAARG
jgi:PEP-CTERM motif